MVGIPASSPAVCLHMVALTIFYFPTATPCIHPPSSKSELLLLGVCDTPLAVQLLLLGGVYTPQPQKRIAAAFHSGYMFDYF